MISNNSISSSNLNDSKYCCVSLIIQLNISHLFTQSNDQIVLFLLIQFSKRHLFAHSFNVKQFYLNHRCYHSRPEWTWESWQWRGTPHDPKLQHYLSLTIRLFNVISRTLIGWGLSPLPRCNRSILLPKPTGLSILWYLRYWGLTLILTTFSIMGKWCQKYTKVSEPV